MQTIAPNIGEGVLAALQSPQPPPTESILTALLNEITTIPDNFILVLDDYHVIDAKPVDDALSLSARAPAATDAPGHHHPRGSTSAPGPVTRPGPIDRTARRRLAFYPSEAAEFLNQVMGLNLSAEDIAALEARTEGWIAGLQLAALSMQGNKDVPGFIRAFAGDHRYIVDYLVEEVLQRQPEPIRSFLLQTAILDRLNGPLCDAVTGQRWKARHDWKPCSGATSLSFRWMTSATGIAITIFLPMFFSMHLMAEQPDQVPVLHQARERVVRAEWFAGTMRSATRWPPRISSERRT